MSYTSWIEAVKSVGLWVESAASEKAKEKGLIHVGKGSYKEKEDGPVVAKSSPDGETLLKVEPGDPEAQAEPEKEPEAEPKKEPTKSPSGTGSAVGLDTPEKRKESLVAGVVTPVGKPRNDMDFDDVKGNTVKNMKNPVVLQGELKSVGLASNVDNLPENTDIEKSTKNRAKSLQEGLEGFASAKTDEEKAQLLNEMAQNRLLEMNFVEPEELRDSKNPNKFTKKKLN